MNLQECLFFLIIGGWLGYIIGMIVGFNWGASKAKLEEQRRRWWRHG